MTSRKRINIISLCLAGFLMLSGCTASGSNSSEVSNSECLNPESSMAETTNAATETETVTILTQKINVTPTPAVKETTVSVTLATETTDPAVTTKLPAASTTAVPAVTTAAPTAETTAPPVETMVAPATDYTAVCAEIKSKLIAILEANGQWDDAFTGESTKSGSQWWGVGFYDDREMSTDDFAQHFYANKFSGRAICGTSITCSVADGNINIEYTAYWTS